MESAAAKRAYGTPQSLVDVLQLRAELQPHRVGYSFSTSDGTIDLSYGELRARAQRIANVIRQLGLVGERVILSLPPGEPFVTGFLGCLCAGATAVPVFPPRGAADTERLFRIMRDARPKAMLTTAAGCTLLRALDLNALQLAPLELIAIDELPQSAENATESVDPGTPAMLQYTSGSTSQPKGVALSHANLMSNLAAIQRAFGHDAQHSRGVVWLPPYHDMGLIGGVLQPLYVGFPVLLLSPMQFIKRPISWLLAIQEYRATSSGGPNFAYELCVKKTTPEQRAALDLRRWEVAFCGAEPIRPETVAAFSDAFAVSGLRRNAFYPCYGLAEGTLIVTGGTKLNGARVSSFDRDDLAHRGATPVLASHPNAVHLISCGQPVVGTQLAVVDPDTGVECLPGRIGEICVSGPGVATGYWNNPEQTERVFRSKLRGRSGHYLRTGDLGFMSGHELYVTGRQKDLIIVRGVNHYPHDLEATVQSVSAALRGGRGTAFGLTRNGVEGVAIVQELEEAVPDPEPIFASIRQRLAEVHGVRPLAIALVRRGTLTVTSSGKLQRVLARDRFLAGDLEVLVRWDDRPEPTTPVEADGVEHTNELVEAARDPERLERFVCSELARQLGQSVNAVGPTSTFAELGLDSVQALEMLAVWENAAGLVIDVQEFYEHPTPRAFAKRVGKLLAASAGRRSTP